MNEKQIKRRLEDNGFRVADVARHLQKDFPAITERSAETMLRRMIAGQGWYPRYAEWFAENYGIVISRPAWLRGVRERMKLAA